MWMGLRLCLLTLVSEDIVVFFGDINLIFYVIPNLCHIETHYSKGNLSEYGYFNNVFHKIGTEKNSKYHGQIFDS